MAENGLGFDKWVAGTVEMKDGSRYSLYSTQTDSLEEAKRQAQAEYDSVDPIVELAQRIASELGASATELLKYASDKVKRDNAG